MKLPDGLPIFPTSHLDWVGYEAIVRDCAKEAANELCRSGNEESAEPVEQAILARYHLEPKP